MILINRTQANTIVVTLKEKQTLEAPYFLFVFKNEQSNTMSACVSTDISLFTYRYNQFVITETNMPNNLNSEVELAIPGFYQYEIYEQTSSTNLNPALATNLLECGKAKVYETQSGIPQFTSTETSTIFNG
jgi:hypothetical protein